VISLFYPLREGGVDRSRSPAVGAWTAGQDLTQERTDGLVRQLEKGLRRTGSLAVAARLIAEEVRSFAGVNPAVGKGLLVITVPKPGIERKLYIDSPMPPVNPRGIGDHFAPSRLTTDAMNFLYVPPDLSAPAASYGPMMLSDGVQFKEVEAWAERPPWWTD
jgi:hypothetical protein